MPRKTNRPGSAEDLAQNVQDRLSRIGGQVRGLARMVQQQRPPVEVLQQLASIRAALRSVTKVLLRDHLERCIRKTARSGASGSYDDLLEAIHSFMK